MDTFSISAFPTMDEFKGKIDTRLLPFLDGWLLREVYHNDIVEIPGHPGSSFDPIKYFQVVKKPGEPFYSESERDNEIGLTLWAHWKGYDHECEVNLFVAGKDVLSGRNKVSAEILKTGGAKMELYWNNDLITTFQQRVWFDTKTLDKVWIDDITIFS